MKSFVSLLVLFLLIGSSYAQIQVNPPSDNLSIEKIIQSIDGEGIIVQNITTNQKQSTNQMAQFDDSQLYTGMQNGMLLSTGSVKMINTANIYSGMTGPISSQNEVPLYSINSNQTGTAIHSSEVQLNSSVPITPMPYYPQTNLDSNKVSLNPNTNYSWNGTAVFQSTQSKEEDLKNELKGAYMLFDACVVEMDIIPMGDTLSFRYMFASEEYDEYVGSRFNDAFAFFISGPGIDGKKNLAVLESGSRVTVNSINNGNPSNHRIEPSNPSFYNRNTGQIPLEFDGFTRTLEIVEPVKAFETYHLKIVIADAGDGALDSGVFIEDGSVISYDYKYTIPFDTDISNLDSTARNILLAMTQVAQDHPEYVLQITGHTDSDGSEASNLILSQSRINSVVDFIVQEGFSSDEIQTINKGESMPMTSNETEEGKRQNRRVEIKLIPSEGENELELTSSTELTSYPNPARSNATIEVKSNKDYEGSMIKVFSTKGTFIAEQSLINSKALFDTSEWEAGIYFYSLVSDGKRIASSRLVTVN